ncbi:ADP-dependent glucokinase/phosphofructokinase, partial [Klebsiella pneumoniae]|uniref:ADP-dependent glucokinase/phosphofructokinase n=2 Tax=Bacteria TaxID=2 RepID=UPI003A895898
LDRIGVPTVQHLVSIDDNVRRLLPSSMRVLSSATRDTLDPHLIVQYPEGASVRLVDGEVVAPASNRLIFANDAPNREMAIAPGLGDALAEAAAFLVSGFNTMQDAALLDRRLHDVRAAMRRLPDSALVYYEDAGFYERSFAGLVRTRLMDRIDVYGMNED